VTNHLDSFQDYVKVPKFTVAGKVLRDSSIHDTSVGKSLK